MEVCVDCIVSAVNAARGGAARLELCSALSEGGLTPSPGTLQVVKRLVNIPVFVMIRPRRGDDFVYSPEEVEVMKIDARILKETGADGFVFGALTADGDVNAKVCQELLNIVSPLPATFHRAFDVSKDMFANMETIVQLGFRRILTSGGESSAEKGIVTIRELIEKANKRVIIMPGGGITAKNIHLILDDTGAIEFHGSATHGGANTTFLAASVESVENMVAIAKEILPLR